MQTIKEQIKNNSIGGAYLIYGEEEYLKDFYTNRIIELCTLEGPKEFNYMKINTDKFDNEAIGEFIVSMPFMSDKKILLMKDTGVLYKSTDETKKFWTEILDSIPDYLTIVFCEKNIDKRNAIYKAITKNHTAEEFPFCKEAELINWFANVLKQSGKMMTKEDICFVIENVGRNMYLLKSEAEKIISFTADKDELISHEDIKNCISKTVEGRIFDLIDNIMSKNHTQAMKGLKDIKTLNEADRKSDGPLGVVALIFRQLSTLRKTKILEGEPVSVIAKKTKLWDSAVKKNIARLKSFTLDDLDEAIILCSKTDTDIKSGVSDPWLAVEKLVISLMTK